MKHLMLSILACCAADMASAAEFEKPVRLKAGGEFIRVESPG